MNNWLRSGRKIESSGAILYHGGAWPAEVPSVPVLILMNIPRRAGVRVSRGGGRKPSMVDSVGTFVFVIILARDPAASHSAEFTNANTPTEPVN